MKWAWILRSGIQDYCGHMIIKETRDQFSGGGGDNQQAGVTTPRVRGSTRLNFKQHRRQNAGHTSGIRF